MPNLDWSNDWTVGVRVWLDRHGEAVLGEGRADLLEAVGKHRSITAAAKAVGMSYRKAWTLIQEVNQAAGEELVSSAVGGIQGGGAQLTERGRAAIEVYRRLHHSLQNRAAAVLGELVGAADPAAPAVHLAVAISLQEAMGQLLASLALHRPLIRVRAIYGASNELADQVLAGAPCDLFISADAAEVDRLEAAGRLAPKSRRAVARNSLVGLRSPGSPPIAKPADLVSAKVGRVALADPSCPLGRLSKRYLEAKHLYEPLAAKALQVDNSRGVIAAVASGAADAGLAFASDAQQTGACELAFRIPASTVAAEYVAAVIAGTGQQESAEAILQYLATNAAARTLRRCGLKPA